MLRGDISNKRSASIVFKAENSLFLFGEEHLLDSLIYKFTPRIMRAEINQMLLKLVSRLYFNTEYHIVLAIENKNFVGKAVSYLEDMPFSQIFNYDNPSEISSRLNTGEFSYYVDDNDISRYEIQSKFAITSRDLLEIVRGIL